MKVYPLSTIKERAIGIAASVAFLACMGLLLYVLRENVLLLILCSLFIVILAVMLLVYIVNSAKASCILDAENKTLELRGNPGFTKDISTAVLVESLPRRMGQINTRVLVFRDEEETPVAVVPTMFTTRSGIQAEPMAKEMAAFLGIEFRENVPVWEYDKEAYKQHLKDEAEQDKKDRKERIARRRQKLMNKYKDK
jgi:hypothetical protein